jgi:hypothetical protein
LCAAYNRGVQANDTAHNPQNSHKEHIGVFRLVFFFRPAGTSTSPCLIAVFRAAQYSRVRLNPHSQNRTHLTIYWRFMDLQQRAHQLFVVVIFPAAHHIRRFFVGFKYKTTSGERSRESNCVVENEVFYIHSSTKDTFLFSLLFFRDPQRRAHVIFGHGTFSCHSPHRIGIGRFEVRTPPKEMSVESNYGGDELLIRPAQTKHVVSCYPFLQIQSNEHIN